jgi:aldehyde dehydrogenase (NAD+)/gamma-glutamyl-gamma-aminobutyraldehyde dehydrogenase
VSNHKQKGFFAKPTLFDGLKEKMTIAQEEIFGPVLGVLTVKSDEEALKLQVIQSMDCMLVFLLKI